MELSNSESRHMMSGCDYMVVEPGLMKSVLCAER